MGVDIVTLRDCASNFGVFEVPSSTPGAEPYTVTLYGSEGPADCTCPSWKYSHEAVQNRECKHVRKLWNGGACLYNPQWKDGVKNPELRPVRYTYDQGIDADAPCPACGGPTVLVRRAI